MITTLLVRVSHYGGSITPDEVRDYVDQTLDGIDKEVSILAIIPNPAEMHIPEFRENGLCGPGDPAR